MCVATAAKRLETSRDKGGRDGGRRRSLVGNGRGGLCGTTLTTMDW